jgi:hypothetical protein
LFTYSQAQLSLDEPPEEGNSFSWFDIAILESPEHTEPRVEKGMKLVWRSHANKTNSITQDISQGKLFSLDNDDPEMRKLVSLLEVRDILITVM